MCCSHCEHCRHVEVPRPSLLRFWIVVGEFHRPHVKIVRCPRMNACAVHTVGSLEQQRGCGRRRSTISSVQCEVLGVAFQPSRVASQGSDLSTRITTYQTMFNVSCTRWQDLRRNCRQQVACFRRGCLDREVHLGRSRLREFSSCLRSSFSGTEKITQVEQIPLI